jgi:hypothetical protein
MNYPGNKSLVVRLAFAILLVLGMVSLIAWGAHKPSCKNIYVSQFVLTLKFKKYEPIFVDDPPEYIFMTCEVAPFATHMLCH